MDRAGTADTTDHRDIPRPYGIIKAGEEGGDIQKDGACFPNKQHYPQWSPAFVEMVAHGKWGMKALFCFACVAFDFPGNCFDLNSRIF